MKIRASRGAGLWFERQKKCCRGDGIFNKRWALLPGSDLS
jgi:hypothetical protein